MRDHLHSTTRQALSAGVAFVAACSFLSAGCGGSSRSSTPEQAASSRIEVVGRFDQAGTEIHGYGFLSHVSGIDDAALFSGGGSLLGAGASEKQALLTFSFQTTLTNRAVHGSIINVGQRGTFDFFLSQRPLADFARPESFAQGEKVASGRLDVQDVLTVTAPNRGLATATGDLLESSARPFTVGGATHVLGRAGQTMHVSIGGPGRRTRVFPPASQFDFAGSLTTGAE